MAIRSVAKQIRFEIFKMIDFLFELHLIISPNITITSRNIVLEYQAEIREVCGNILT